MYTGLLHLHSLLRWVLLLFLLITLVKAFKGRQGGLVFGPGDRRNALITLITAHVQLVLGLILYMISPLVLSGRSNPAAGMKDGILRFWMVEHLITMVLAIIFITVAYSRMKRSNSDAGRFKALFTFMLIGLLLILIGIPWPFREVGAGRGWF